MQKFEVRFLIEVRAASPEQAATIARDMLLDPDSDMHADVHPIEYYKAADDYFPVEGRGWSVYFGDSGSEARNQTYGGPKKPYKGASARPSNCVAWGAVKT
jgi:hypothetical protein